jgi:geranylgeranyl transferase type-2 subunit beta
MSTTLETTKHVDYIERLGKVTRCLAYMNSTEEGIQNTDDLAYHLTSHLRINAVYWGFTAVSVMGQPTSLKRDDMIEFVMSCWDEKEGICSIW